MPAPPDEGSPLDRLMLGAAGAIGALFFLWIAGLRIVTPTDFNWVMQGDWRLHFLGWHFFRREPWHWPPGRIEGYMHAPDGTAIGFTDSIPLVAFALKPFSDLLPATFQYLGLWLLACFILQGVFGVLLARLWTLRRSLHLLTAVLFILMPALLSRVNHPALSAHWLVLWALWLYLRSDRVGAVREPPRDAISALGLTAGLVHPYLAVMVLAMLAALAVHDPRARRGFACATLLVAVGWWASGLLTVPGTDNLASEGLGRYSMHPLSPVAPRGWSSLLPEMPVVLRDDHNEGFQYFGLGALLLIGIATVVSLCRFRTLPWRRVWPLVAVAVLCAIYSGIPTGPDGYRFALFRASGRFFWPMAYLLLASSIAISVARLPARMSMAVLVLACVLQFVDLQNAHLERRRANRSEYFHAHQPKLTSPVWRMALPHYKHIVLYPPEQCGRAPATFEWPAYLAGLYGLTINAGEAARYDAHEREAYCRSLDAKLLNGDAADETLFIVERSRVELLHARSPAPIVCGAVDDLPVCVSRRSYERWRSGAPFGPI